MIQVLYKIFNFSPRRQGVLVKSIVISLVGAVFSAFQFAALMLVLDGVVQGERTDGLLWKSVLIMVVSVAGHALCLYHATNQQTEAGYFMVADKRVHIGDRLRYIPMGYFNKNSLGNITAVVTTTLTDVENSASRCLVMLLGGFLNTLVLSLFMIGANVQVGLTALAGIVIYLFVTEWSQRSAKDTAPARIQAQETLVEAVLEYIQGMSVVKAYGLERDGNQKASRAIAESCEKSLGIEYALVPALAVQQLVVRGFSVLVAVMALVVYQRGGMELSRCLLMLAASFLIYRELESAGNMSALLQLLDSAIDKANGIDETPVMDIDGKDVQPLDRSIRLEHVEFSYGSRKILDDVTLSIPAGSTTAIVGPSGSGKTTLCNLIARFWDVQGGSVQVGGRDVRDYKLDSLMKHISMVFQNVYLFQDTIENNIRFGRPDATHEQVVAAAKAACCHEFIMALPEGYQTVLGEGGGSLSGGEKQRISIARAILKDAPIIILDEATASVDPENEDKLQAAIDALSRGKTLVMIAHRLKTVRNADQIVVLDAGRIVQQGTHKELIARPGIYADFIGVRREAAGWKL